MELRQGPARAARDEGEGRPEEYNSDQRHEEASLPSARSALPEEHGAHLQVALPALRSRDSPDCKIDLHFQSLACHGALGGQQGLTRQSLPEHELLRHSRGTSLT